jgi:hypothetical protein
MHLMMMNCNNMAANDNNMQGMQEMQGMQRATRVLRFEFSDALTDHLTAFAKLHQYDDRKTYKEAWAEWMANDEIATLFNADAARLKCLGYNGDVADKLYKSGRYYFRGKKGQENKGQENKGQENKGQNGQTDRSRKYIMLGRELLTAMDDHIERGLRQNDYTPAKGFAEFCQLGIASYHSEVARLSEVMPSGEDVSDKLKKTYKNRYFILAKAFA